MSILLGGGMLAAGALSAVHAVRRVTAARGDRQRGRTDGAFGERRVGQILDRIGLPHIGDVTFSWDGRTVHADHLVLAGAKLVAIGTRSFGGRISVAAHGGWTQWTPVRRTLPNPVARNMAHRNAIAECSGCACDGIVVVVGDARFQGGMPEGAVALAGLPGARSAGRLRAHQGAVRGGQRAAEARGTSPAASRGTAPPGIRGVGMGAGGMRLRRARRHRYLAAAAAFPPAAYVPADRSGHAALMYC